MNKKAGIFLIGVIVLIILIISSGIVYFRFTSSGLEVIPGNKSVPLGSQNNLSEDAFVNSEKSNSLNISSNASINENKIKSNRTKIEIVEVNITK